MAGEQNSTWSLKGMTALVTGGTRGSGCAVVEELARFGATVYTCARNQKYLDERLQEWEAKGYKVKGSTCDFSSRTQREELMKCVSDAFDGKLNILNFSTSPFESPFHTCQLAYPLLKESGNGSIVLLSSTAGQKALHGFSSYGGPKEAISQLTKDLACEWAKDKIRVNTVAPFAVKTSPVTRENVDMSVAGMMRPILGGVPLGPIAEANPISPLVTFLCLPGAAYITGQVIAVDGGFTASGF